MDKFVALVLSGLVFGSLYSLVGAGLVLTYSTSRMFNFGHGAVAFVAALFYYELTVGLGWPKYLAAVLVVLVFSPALGVCINRLVFRPLVGASDSSKIVATIGLLVALPALALWIVERLRETFGVDLAPTDNVVTLPGLGPQPKHVWQVGDLFRIDSTQLVILALALACSIGLWFLFRHTDLGLRMRATVDRPELAQARGVDGDRVTEIAWALGFTLSGLVGVAGATVVGLYPRSFESVLFIGATAAILGRLKTVQLALVGGLMLGVIQNLVAGYATFAKGITGFSTSVPFIFLLAGLILLGWDRSRKAGQAVETPATDQGAIDLPRWRRAMPRVIAALIVVSFVFLWANRYWLGLGIQGLAYAIVLLSFVVVTGLGRMVSLAQSTFVMVAAMTTGLVLSHSMPFAVAAVAGIATATVTGAVVAMPALRLEGVFLALASLSLAILCDRVLFAWDPFRNGPSGWRISRPALGPIDFSNDRTYALLLLVLVALVALGVHNLRRSRIGRAIVAVQVSEPGATSVGLSIVRTRLVVFSLSAAVAGLGGIMLATANQSISNTAFTPSSGLMWLLVIVLFGVSRIEGAIIGGLVIAVSGEVVGWFSNSPYIPGILFGLSAIQLASAPEGILVHFSQQLRGRRANRSMRRARSQDVATKVSLPNLGADATSEQSVLCARGLHASYGSVPVLHGVDLRLEAGRISAVLGVNGAGKSTLCRVLAGLHAPTAGEILLGAEDVTAMPTFMRARSGIFLAPESRGIFPELTVIDNLRLSLGNDHDLSEVFEQFPQLATRRNVPANHLSGGEQQMLTLAPVVVHTPRVVIADEPTLGLAPRVADAVMEIFVRLRERGTAILIVDEKYRNVLRVADDVAVLELGHVTWAGAASDVEADELAATYLKQGAAR